ncbi:hypothetical protein LCGC14_1249310, partial [marine sediment metagenome]
PWPKIIAFLLDPPLLGSNTLKVIVTPSVVLTVFPYVDLTPIGVINIKIVPMRKNEKNRQMRIIFFLVMSIFRISIHQKYVLRN